MTTFSPEQEPKHISEIVSLQPEELLGNHSYSARTKRVNELSLVSEVEALQGLREEAVEDHVAGYLTTEDADRAIPGLTASMLDAQADLYKVILNTPGSS